MNAQDIINTCNIKKFDRDKFRKEMNLSFFINDVKKQFTIFNNEDGGANSSSKRPAPSNLITEKEVKNGKIN